MILFVEISIIVAVAAIISLLMKFFKQPLIVGYIATGVIVGPYVFNILQAHNEIELFSKIGIAILLFLIGLTLNPDVMREVGKTSLITGIGQVLFTSIIGYFLVRTLGFEILSSLYIAVALTFSSTIIILKLLSDKGDIKTLYGKISIGFLLVQDIIASILLLVITIASVAFLSIERTLSNVVTLETLVLLTKGVLVTVILYLVSRYILPHISKFVASSQEILSIFSLAWGLGMASFFYTIGFSLEIGALIAGVTLAASPFAYEIVSRLKPLRDFFIMLFFIMLGSQLVLGQFMMLIVPALALSLFVLIGNPLIMLLLMNLMGYRTRTAFMSGLTVAQISEFSLILITLGYSFGHVSQEAVSLVTLVGIITITGSTYLILYAEQIYSFLKPVLRFLTFRKSHIKEKVLIENVEIIIFGYDRVGSRFVETAKKITDNYLVIDYNPLSIERLEKLGIPHCYGDAEDVDFLDEINISKAKLVVSTIPDSKTNLLLVSHYRAHNQTGIIITISHDIYQTKELYELGASYVVMPHHLGASHAASLMDKHRFSEEAFKQEKDNHLKSLAIEM
ncbi:MAG: Transporter, CPA2 family [Parcubacteria group bacterium GW2011_GWB1_38_8]|nr:MAG: Transporter, CPA2 family [Parcubacteria group bacterium GW2011_GWB1_38_8]